MRFAAARAEQAWRAAQGLDVPVAWTEGPGGPWLVQQRPEGPRALRWVVAVDYLRPMARGSFVLDGSGQPLEVGIPGPDGPVTFVPRAEEGPGRVPLGPIGRGLGLALVLGVVGGRLRRGKGAAA